jgi:Outer mitochondrial membrane transport complex protein
MMKNGASKYSTQNMNFEFYAPSQIDSESVSLDFESVFLEILLKLSLCSYQHKRVYQHGFSPNGKLPCLGLEGDVFAGRENLLRLLDKRGYSLDKNLTESQISQSKCFLALLDSQVKFALDYELWFDSSNYQTLTNVSIGGKYPFPLNLIVPGMERSLIIQDMLSRQPVLKNDTVFVY